MLLRRSGDLSNEAYELTGVTGEGNIGVEQESILIEIAEAVFAGEPEQLRQVRDKAALVLNQTQLVDAIGVASAFNGITRIANATGLPLDSRTEEITVELRQATGIDHYSDDHKAGVYDTSPGSGQ